MGKCTKIFTAIIGNNFLEIGDKFNLKIYILFIDSCKLRRKSKLILTNYK